MSSHPVATLDGAPPVRAVDADAFRRAMRQLAGGISVITVGSGDDLSGLTVTSVASLSAEPPAVVFCINRSSSSWPLLQSYRVFGVNVLAHDQEHVAARFTGRGGAKGPERYLGETWMELETGAPILSNALVSLDCTVDQTVDRAESSIVIGTVVALRVRSDQTVQGALTYWRGAFGVLRHS